MSDNERFLNQVAEVLEDAAKILDEKGWVRGSFGSERIGFCAVGALRYVREIPLFECAPQSRDPIYREARQRLTNFLGRRITSWNDERDRNKDQVTQALRSAARNVRAGVES